MTTWMLLEDEPDLYDMILAMYDMLGIGGVAFGSGEDAVTWIEDVEKGTYDGELPQLALLDIRLPDNINGPMVGARMRESPVLNDTVLVLMTAYRLSASEERDVLEYSGADYVLYKPLPAFKQLRYILGELAEGRYPLI